MNNHLEAALAAAFTIDSNPGHGARAFPDRDGSLDAAVMDRARAEIGGWAGYAPTPLHDLPEIADLLGVSRVVYKDESARFGLGSFKALGGAYAVAALVRRLEAAGGRAADLTVATATDGNHGRSVAWGAARAGCAAKIYIHAHVSEAREAAMAAYGADIIRVNGNYEASLEACKQDAAAHGWQIVSDTSWEGYHEVPLMVMAGYTVMAGEVLDQLGGPPSHALLPVGVGDEHTALGTVQQVQGVAAGKESCASVLVISGALGDVGVGRQDQPRSERGFDGSEFAVERVDDRTGASCGHTRPLGEVGRGRRTEDVEEPSGQLGSGVGLGQERRRQRADLGRSRARPVQRHRSGERGVAELVRVDTEATPRLSIRDGPAGEDRLQRLGEAEAGGAPRAAGRHPSEREDLRVDRGDDVGREAWPPHLAEVVAVEHGRGHAVEAGVERQHSCPRHAVGTTCVRGGTNALGIGGAAFGESAVQQPHPDDGRSVELQDVAGRHPAIVRECGAAFRGTLVRPDRPGA